MDRQTRDLVDEMVTLGWVARRTKRGHVVLRAPDGATATLGGTASDHRAHRNARAMLQRWKRGQGDGKQ